MPELPEVETLRRDLEATLVGHRITEVRATGRRSVRRAVAPEAFEAELTARTVVSAGRHGKYLLLRLDGGGVWVTHLRMSGQLLVTERDAPLAIHTHVRVFLAGGRELRFVDPRTFGEMYVTTDDAPELAHLGPDALLALPAPGALLAAARRRRVAVKTLLLDQRFVAGLGNIYADEVLHRARLRSDRPADGLRRGEAVRLHEAIGAVLTEAVAARGSTLGDAQYVDAYGRAGGFATAHRVYDREGLPCLTCGRPIVRVRLGGRSAYSCRRCQR